MRTVRPCLEPGCGRLTTGTRCAEHRRKRDTGRRDDEPWRAVYSDPRWAPAVRACLRAAGGRCMGAWGGVRCNATTGLQAHHTIPLRVLWLRGQQDRAFDVALLAALCPRCHAAAEEAQRVARSPFRGS